MIDADAPLPRGAALGRYVVLATLGRGGMGVVYQAYDPDLDRKVALKLLQTTAADEQARLVREGKAMARLSHPNVAAVFDVGVHEGQVFIAMELVEGETLRAWLDGGHTWREVVAMFVQAGRGLAAAHAAGIVHRDFKPDNALVGEDGRARVVDFGLARTSDAPPGDHADDAYAGGLTSAGSSSLALHASIVGTPRYMPPEQLAGEQVAASADQFAFCASLWEALHGAPPYDGEDLLALAANMQEGKLAETSASRGVPTFVRQALVRGLAPDPQARHPSMSALLDALTHDPAARRSRWLAAGLVLFLVVGGAAGARAVAAPPRVACPSAEARLAGVWDDARRAGAHASFRATGKPYAETAFRGAEGALDAYAAAWLAMHDDACAATLVRGQQSSELMDLRMACLDDRMANLRALTDRFVHADGDVVLHAIQAANGLPPISDCADATALRAPVREPADPAKRAQIAAVRMELAEARATRPTLAKPDEGVAGARRIAGEAKGIGWGPLVAEALEDEGEALSSAHDMKSAADVLREAEVAAVASHHDAVETTAWIKLTQVEAWEQRVQESHQAAAQAHACLDREGGDDLRLAELLVYESRLAQTEGDLDLATEKATAALAIRTRLLPPEHPSVAQSIELLGIIAWRKGDNDGALERYRQVLAIEEKTFGPDHPVVAAVLGNMANALSDEGKDDEAVALMRRVVDIFRGAYGEESTDVADALENLGLAVEDTGDDAQALEIFQRALAIRLRLLRPDHPDIAVAYGNLATALMGLGRWDDAIAASKKRLEMQERANGPDYPPLARPLSQLCEELVGKGRPAEALPYCERALPLAETGRVGALTLAQVREQLAIALRATRGDPARMRDLATKSRDAYLAMNNRPYVDRIEREIPEVAPQMIDR